MKKMIFALLVLMTAFPASAEIIMLKSGKSIEGEIIEQNPELIRIKVKDQILSIRYGFIENGDELRSRPFFKNENPASAESSEKALLATIATGDLDSLNRLLSSGADINQIDAQGRTALLLAVEFRRMSMAKALIEAGADLEVKGRQGYNALHLSAFNGLTDIFKLLVEKGADPQTPTAFGTQAIHLASETGAVDIVQILLERGIDVNLRDSQGMTPLHVAARGGQLEVLQLLLSRSGARVNAQNAARDTPLHLAASSGHSKVVDLLLDHGAVVNAKNITGKTPLNYATENRMFETVQFLTDRGGKESIDQPMTEAKTINCRETYQKAKIQLLKDRKQKAIPFLEEVARTCLNNQQAHSDLATIAVEEKRFSDAVPHLNELLDRDPDNEIYHYRMAEALNEIEKRKEEAVAYYKNYLKFSPDGEHSNSILERFPELKDVQSK